jgi:hypothetical protein
LQQFGKIIRDADGNVVEVNILEETSENVTFDDNEMTIEETERPIGKSTAVVEGTSHNSLCFNIDLESYFLFP